MECIFLGTNGGVPSVKRHNTSLFIRNHQNEGLLVDCNGVCVQRLVAANVDFANLQHIFITHKHIDHIGALGCLMQQVWLQSCHFKDLPEKRVAPMHIYSSEDAISSVKALFEALEIQNHPHIFDIVFHPLPENESGDLDIGGMSFSYLPVNHSVPCFGLMTGASGGQKLVFSSDTGICDDLYKDLKVGDVLIHECSSIDQDKSKGHTTWKELEAVLDTLPDITLYLVHLPVMDEAEEADFSAYLKEKYASRVLMAQDGMVVNI